MKVTVVKFGKPAFQASQEFVAEYHKRLSPWGQFERTEVRDPDQVPPWLASPQSGRALVTLDERGKSLSSPQLANRLADWQADPGLKHLVFVIGGPYGLPDAVSQQQATFKWSLSNLTFPSDIAWLLCWEQLYRACSINAGRPYHHGS